MSQTSSRLLELLSLLQGRRDWPGDELADRLEVSGRTIRRDVERLRQLGYPVESLTGPAGGYRLRAGSAMPPLLLDDEEAIAIAVGLRTAARASVTGIEETAVRALVKLEQVLPAHLRRRVGALGSATITLPVARPDGRSAAPDRDRRGLPRLRVPSLRLPKPGWHRQPPRGRAALPRQPRPPLVSRRMGSRAATTGGPSASTGWPSRPRPACASRARRLPAKDAAAYVEQSITGAPNRFEARVTLRAAAEEITSRVPAYWGTIEPIDAHTCEYRTGDDDLGWLALRVAMLGVDFEVHEPPELVEHLRALAMRLRRAVR